MSVYILFLSTKKKKKVKEKMTITNSLEDCKTCFYGKSKIERVRDSISLNMIDLGSMNH